MIGDLDRTIEKLLQSEFGVPLPFDLSFSVPEKTFSPVSTNKLTLDCYLYDISEDRDLRSAAPMVREKADGTCDKIAPPVRVKLSYRITAWSPAPDSLAVVAAIDEHQLLSNVLKVLLKYPTLPSSALMGSLIGQEPPLPATAISPDGGKNTWDFWNAIGGQLRPSLDYRVTLSMSYLPAISFPMATTLRVGLDGDEFYIIGGTVWDSSPAPRGIPGAWVRLDETGHTYVTDAEGRFRIDRIAAGAYTFTVRAVGYREGSKPRQVPQPDGVYDVTLIPL